MNPTEWSAVAMLVVEAAALALRFHQHAFALLVATAALVSLFVRARTLLTQRTRALGAVLAAVVVGVHWAVDLQGRDVPEVLYYGSAGYLAAEYLLLLHLGSLFLRRPEQGKALQGPLCGTAVMALAGGVMATETNDSYGLAAFLFTILLVVHLQSRRPPHEGHTRIRRLWLGFTMAGALFLGAAGSLILRAYGSDIDLALANLTFGAFPVSASGFSGTARLGSVVRLKEGGATVALRAVSDALPGYLRGRAFDTYGAAEWHVESPARGVEPCAPGEGLPEAGHGRHLFRLDDRASSSWLPMGIEPCLAAQGFIFAPLEAAVLGLPATRMITDANRNASVAGEMPEVGYEAYLPVDAPRPPPGLNPQFRERLLEVPDDLDPRIRALAEELFQDRETPGQKVRAVVDYFDTNYEYDLGVVTPSGVDPLTYFLLEKPAAHCEFFAAGAAVLLRLGGVPCRYVTGFVVHERNALGGYWLARNRDAHAWVEAYDDQAGWSLVEATVAGGVPAEEESGGLRWLGHAMDLVRCLVQRVKAAYRSGGWKDAVVAVLQAAWQALGSVPGLAMLLGFLAWGARRAWKRTRRRKAAAPARDPDLIELGRILARADRAMKRRGLVRSGTQTLHHFAEVIATGDGPEAKENAQWYRDFAGVRYRGSPDPDQIADLRRRAPK